MPIFRQTAKKAWDIVLNHGRVFSRNPGFVISLFLGLMFSSGLLNKVSSSFSSERYLAANRLPSDSPSSSRLVECDLLLVATKKDFPSLSLAIASAINSQGRIEFTQVNIVVPTRFLTEARNIIFSAKVPISIIDEDSYFESTEKERIEEVFGLRSGWVKQQLIKIRHVCRSNVRFTLVLDADTFLLRERAWFDSLDRQVLFQSEEFNSEYYDFMDKLGLRNSRQSSFITHYMLFDKLTLEDALRAANIFDQPSQVSEIIRNSNLKSESPFSIDYELYGQYLLANDLCVVRKWSHRDIDSRFLLNAENKEKYLQKYSRKWSSVSVHSWHRA